MLVAVDAGSFVNVALSITDVWLRRSRFEFVGVTRDVDGDGQLAHGSADAVLQELLGESLAVLESLLSNGGAWLCGTIAQARPWRWRWSLLPPSEWLYNWPCFLATLDSVVLMLRGHHGCLSNGWTFRRGPGLPCRLFGRWWHACMSKRLGRATLVGNRFSRQVIRKLPL
jgi:hypothetical protein